MKSTKKLGLFGLAIAAITAIAFGTGIFSTSVSAANSPEIGEAAPLFTSKTTALNTFNLLDQKGKVVVLEWTNNKCPFVRKHYDSKNMQDLQKEAAEDGVVWVTIVSSASGKQGHVDEATANQIIKAEEASPTHKILDEKGIIGKLYDAKTTPHMFIIDEKGTLVYKGAIDDDSSHYADRAKGANNYVRAALANLKAGEKVATAETRPYGCSVKY